MVHIRLTNVIIERKGNSSTTKYKYYYPRLCHRSLDFKTLWERRWFKNMQRQADGNSLLYCIQSEDIYL